MALGEGDAGAFEVGEALGERGFGEMVRKGRAELQPVEGFAFHGG